MHIQTVVRYLLIAVLVMIVGAFAGWYLFLRQQTSQTESFSSSLGIGTQAPFGSAGGTSGAFSNTGTSSTQGSGQPPQLWHVTSAPVAGFGFATSSDGIVLRYVEQATGYVFDASVATGSIARAASTLMPKTYDAYVASDGRVSERGLDDSGAITTFDGKLSTGTSTELAGTTLSSNVEAFALDPTSAQVFTIVRQGTGVTGVLSGWDGSKPKTIFTSAVPGWRAWWLADGTIIVMQKAATAIQSYSYVLRNGSKVSFLEPLPGLTFSPSGVVGTFLFSTSSGGAPALYLHAATSSAQRLSISTLAEKCAWATTADVAFCGVPASIPSTDYLDRWYRGEVHTADSIWSIDASTGTVTQVFTPDSSLSLDVEHPVVDGRGLYLAFRDATDRSLWLLRLSQ